MLVYIDESGDPGFKITKGATPIFVLAMIYFSDYEKANNARVKIKDLLLELNIPEFKFSKTNDRYRTRFFEVAKTIDFNANVLIVDKSLIYSPKLKNDKDSFYNYFVKQLLGNDCGLITNPSTIYIDGSGNRDFKKNLNCYLRKETCSSKIKTINLVDSKKEPLVQLSDMVAGAAHRASNRKKCNNIWFSMIANAKKINNL